MRNKMRKSNQICFCCWELLESSMRVSISAAWPGSGKSRPSLPILSVPRTRSMYFLITIAPMAILLVICPYNAGSNRTASIMELFHQPQHPLGHHSCLLGCKQSIKQIISSRVRATFRLPEEATTKRPTRKGNGGTNVFHSSRTAWAQANTVASYITFNES